LHFVHHFIVNRPANRRVVSVESSDDPHGRVSPACHASARFRHAPPASDSHDQAGEGLDTITVTVDQATITKIPESASTLVVGNPLIADVTVRLGGLLVVTGKSYGVTNLVVLDASGAVLSEHYVDVRSPRDDVVILYCGVNRESCSCSPGCEPRIMLGESLKFFTSNKAATARRKRWARRPATDARARPRRLCGFG
jgi:Pilus formation protein N terminal region